MLTTLSLSTLSTIDPHTGHKSSSYTVSFPQCRHIEHRESSNVRIVWYSSSSWLIFTLHCANRLLQLNHPNPIRYAPLEEVPVIIYNVMSPFYSPMNLHTALLWNEHIIYYLRIHLQKNLENTRESDRLRPEIASWGEKLVSGESHALPTFSLPTQPSTPWAL